MATVTKTFTFDSGTEGWSFNSSVDAIGWFDSTDGDPSPGSLTTRLVSGGEGSYWSWEGTWEQLGVPEGATVTALRLTSARNRVAEVWIEEGGSATFGPYQLLSTTSSDQVIFWTGRSGSGESESEWTVVAPQSAASVPVPIRASSTTIALRLHNFMTGGGNGTQIHEDTIEFEITYSAGSPPVEVTKAHSTSTYLVHTVTKGHTSDTNLLKLPGGNLRNTLAAVEALSSFQPRIRASQAALETLSRYEARLRQTRSNVEVLYVSAGVSLRTSMTAAEVYYNRIPTIRNSVTYLEVFRSLLGTATRGHTTSTMLVYSSTKVHSTSTQTSISHTTEHSTSAVLYYTLTRTHTTNTALQSVTSRVHTSSTLVQATRSGAHLSDVLVKQSVMLAHSSSLYTRANAAIIHTTEALLWKTLLGLHNTNVIARAEQYTQHTADSLIRRAVLISQSVDVSLAGSTTVVASTDIALGSAGVRPHATDIDLAGSATQSHTTNSLTRSAMTAQQFVDLLLGGTTVRTHGADVGKVAEFNRAHQVDTLLYVGRAATHTVDTLKLLPRLISQSSSSLLAGVFVVSTSVDSKLWRTPSLYHSTNVGKVAVRARQHSTQAVLRLEGVRHHTDSYLVAQFFVGIHSTDVCLLAERLLIHSVTTNLRKYSPPLLARFPHQVNIHNISLQVVSVPLRRGIRHIQPHRTLTLAYEVVDVSVLKVLWRRKLIRVTGALVLS